MSDVMAPEITPAMAGTWLDGHMGWHNAYRVVLRAEEYGFVVPEDYRDAMDAYRESGSSFSFAEKEEHWDAINGQGELSDQATEYLQEHAPEGFSFVWDMGELILMSYADAELF
ncbi:hypothetical protein [Streptomyces sp. NPDC057253]|uniref:hypothetical protein n=1 Tax=Streptomyces sp. NPDC057253 TaxID=3346069 RepID=UPI0036290F6B